MPVLGCQASDGRPPVVEHKHCVHQQFKIVGCYQTKDAVARSKFLEHSITGMEEGPGILDIFVSLHSAAPVIDEDVMTSHQDQVCWMNVSVVEQDLVDGLQSIEDL